MRSFELLLELSDLEAERKRFVTASQLRSIARCMWAKNVLEEHADHNKLLVTPHPFRLHQDGPFKVMGFQGTWQSRDAAMVGAAELALEGLPKDTRATLGECP